MLFTYTKTTLEKLLFFFIILFDRVTKKNLVCKVELLFVYLRLKKHKIVTSLNVGRLQDHLFFVSANIAIPGNHYGSSVSESKEEALSISLGESLERYITYSRGFSPQKSETLLTYDQAKELYDHVYFPSLFHTMFGIEDKHKAKYKQSKLIFLEGFSLLDKKRVALPGQLVYWGERKSFSKEPILLHANTSGMAGFFTKSGAILRGLLEVIERDAFLCHWLTKCPPLHFDKKTFPDHIKNKISYYEKKEQEVFVLNSTTDVQVPSVIALLYNNKKDAWVVSLSARLSIEEAINSSLLELAKLELLFDDDDDGKALNELEKRKERGKKFSFPNNPKDRIFIARGEKFRKGVDWIFSGDCISFEESKKNDLVSSQAKGEEKEDFLLQDSNKLEQLCKHLLTLEDKYHPYYYEHKDKALDELGFHVVTTVVPELMPLYLDEKFAITKSQRLTNFSYSKRGRGEFILNEEPHPFY
ncbi:MAG: hypothetical protein RI935_758 [Candidatus Parcubacteria bacterium]|jgi:ribosomal protein S12 methylthiotransferase accessory factor